jgi:hypothetical protein
MRQAVIAVLLFVFLGHLAWAGIKEELAADTPLQEVVQAALDSNIILKDLIADLAAAEVSGPAIICALFQAGQEHATVITAALDGGLSPDDVAGWAGTCRATYAEIQAGYSMTTAKLPAHMVFATAAEYEKYAEEYLYNPPSPSK